MSSEIFTIGTLMTKSIFTENYALFRKLLIEARHNAGLTQAALGKKLNKPQSFVYKYENGERRLDLIEFLDIADVLEINPHEFIDKLYE